MHYTLHPLPSIGLPHDHKDYQPIEFDADEFFIKDGCYMFRVGDEELMTFPMQHVWRVLEEVQE